MIDVSSIDKLSTAQEQMDYFKERAEAANCWPLFIENPSGNSDGNH